MLQPIKITPSALTEIKYILEKKNIPAGYGLRVGIAGSRGCAGVQFSLGFDLPKENDLSFEIENVPVHIQKHVVMFLVNKEIDFTESEDARGFFFQDAN